MDLGSLGNFGARAQGKGFELGSFSSPHIPHHCTSYTDAHMGHGELSGDHRDDEARELQRVKGRVGQENIGDMEAIGQPELVYSTLGCT